MTYRLIYTSKAAPHVTDADFRTIAMFSSISNKRQNISGLLLHNKGMIMQVLEGHEDEVKALYSRIERDKRHYNIKIELSAEFENPYFQDWSMGYRPIESSEQMDAFFELSKANLDKVVLGDAEEGLLEIIGDFATTSGIT